MRNRIAALAGAFGLLFIATTAASAASIGTLAQLGAVALAQNDDEERDPTEGRNVRRTPTMREAVYKKLSEAQTAAEADDMATAREMIAEVQEMRNLSGYETAQIYNFQAFIAYSSEDYPGAIRAYQTVLEQEDVPEAMYNQTLFSLAQLHFAVEDYAGAERYLRQWMGVVPEPTADSYILLAQAIYSQERYADALQPMEEGIALARANDIEVKEQWLLLLRVLHYEMENYPKVAEILEELIRRFPKKQYWLQLSGVYGELEQPERRLITLEIAYRQGLFDKEQEYMNLAQLLMQQEIPYRGAQVLEDGISKGVIEKTYKNMRVLGQAYLMAQEEEKAVDPLSEAAARSSDGDLDLQLANIYLNLEQFADAEASARNAIEKETDREGDAWFMVGMALFSQEKLGDAQRAFEQATKDRDNRAAASQWITYIEKERERREQLAAAVSGP
ncbi:MAG: tetratricopeptide repeat protein [Pseudomonadota bacterium]